jgi:hypothetical protein
MKKKAVANLGAEEAAQTKAKILTRASTRAEADLLFANKATEIARKNRVRLAQLFRQMPGAETMAPTLVKMSSLTPATDAFFDKVAEARLTPAQRRYPELLKASAATIGNRPTPDVKARNATQTKGAQPVQSSLSGGAA